jgi:hypothetical protein
LRLLSLMLGCPSKEGANRGKLASGGRRSQPRLSPVGEKCAKIGGAYRGEGGRLHLFAAIASEEADQAVGSRDIGPHRVRRPAAIVGEMVLPGRYESRCRMR